jgi:molybdopterin converting factor small subunit
MSVEVSIPPSFQSLINGIKTVEVSGKTVEECLDNLVTRFPLIKSQLFGRGRKLRKGLSIYINREGIDVKELARAVNDGDKLYILNLIFGG